MTRNIPKGAESETDRFTYGVLLNADASPAALGDMFQRLRDKYGDNDAIIMHFLSHPGLQKRIEAARAAAPQDQDYQLILDGEGWAALQGICKK